MDKGTEGRDGRTDGRPNEDNRKERMASCTCALLCSVLATNYRVNEGGWGGTDWGGRGQGGSGGEHRDIGGGRVILVSSLVQLAMLPFVAFCRHLSRLEHFGRGGAVFSVAWASGTIKIAS